MTSGETYVLKHVRSSDNWRQQNFGAKGFTLIEVLIVIIILGILASVVALAVVAVQDKGRTDACDTEKKTVESAAAAYYSDHDEDWPDDIGDLTATGDPLGGPYLKDDPDHPWDISATGDATGVDCEDL
jgi:general secretion pathway protein G